MLNKIRILGSVASIALAVAASPAFAQSPLQSTAVVASATPPASLEAYKAALAERQSAIEQMSNINRQLNDDYQRQLNQHQNLVNEYDAKAQDYLSNYVHYANGYGHNDHYGHDAHGYGHNDYGHDDYAGQAAATQPGAGGGSTIQLSTSGVAGQTTTIRTVGQAIG